MSDSEDVLSPARVAAAVAPIVDRLRLAIARRVPDRARDLATRLDLSPQGLQMLAMLRNTMPDRVVDRMGIDALYIYTPPDQVDAAVAELTGNAFIAAHVGESLILTDRARESLTELYKITTALVDELWAGHELLIEQLAEIAQRAVAAAANGGPASAVMNPPWEPRGASPAMLLAERLTPLRFHRFDAHVAAWQAAGLTAEVVQNLSAGREREAIEADTNERAGRPYGALAPAERFLLCAGLGALPN